MDKNEIDSVAEKILQKFAEGNPVRSIVKGHDRAWEVVYFRAHQLYKYGQYKQAENLFLLLCFSDPEQERYWVGLGLTRQKQEKYALALHAYLTPMRRGTCNAWVALHSAECYFKSGLYAEAIGCLNLATSWLEADEANPNRETIEQRIQGLQRAAERKNSTERQNLQQEAVTSSV